MLFITLSVFSFVSVSFGALAFGERFGTPPRGQETLTNTNYMLQTDEYPVQADLTLGLGNIMATGDNFIAVIFGTPNRLITPDKEEPLKVGESIAVIGKLVEEVADEQIFDAIFRSPNLKSLFVNLDRYREMVFLLGLSTVCRYKRPYDGSLYPEPKRRKLETKAHYFQSLLLHNPLNLGMCSPSATSVIISVPEVSSRPSAAVQIESGLLDVKCKNGAQVFVLRDEKILGESIMFTKPFFNLDLPLDDGTVSSLFAPQKSTINVMSGDVVVLLLPSSERTTLETLCDFNLKLSSARFFAAENAFRQFLDEHCGNDMIAVVLSLG
jgi:hypothetical protein